MKWHGYWWGVVLLAEDEEDAELLTTLGEALPHKAAHRYDDGILKIGPGPFLDEWDVENECRLYLEFDR